MRNRFSEMIQAGIAVPRYTTYAIGSTPETDLICKEYNNIFSIPTDTHMSKVGDCYIITGTAVSAGKWEDIMNSVVFSAIDFRPSGYYNMADFFAKHNIIGEKDIMNGDIIFRLQKLNSISRQNPKNIPSSIKIGESNIPQPISILGNKDALIDCFYDVNDLYEVVRKLNSNPHILGNDWYVSQDGSIQGIVNNTIYKIYDTGNN